MLIFALIIFGLLNIYWVIVHTVVGVYIVTARDEVLTQLTRKQCT